jgi:hypothetical protein
MEMQNYSPTSDSTAVIEREPRVILFTTQPVRVNLMPSASPSSRGSARPAGADTSRSDRRS